MRYDRNRYPFMQLWIRDYALKRVVRDRSFQDLKFGVHVIVGTLVIS